MKTLEITLAKDQNISKKVSLIKDLYDYNEEKEVIEVKLTGMIVNSEYGNEKINYELIELKGKNIIYKGMKFEVRSETVKLEVFIYER